jgi:hypothetical protein
VEDFAKSVNTDPSKVELRSMEDRNLADSGEPAGDDYCDCGEHGDMRRHEYRYFNPSFNYVDKHGKLTDGNTPEEVRKYVRQDYERMESLNAGHWCYIGIRATAEIAVSSVGIAGGALIQTIRSGGLWGIESDSDKDHFAEVETEELAQLRVELKAIGFSTRAISTAFKNIEEVSE